MKLATTTADFAPYCSDQFLAMTYIREAGFRYLDYNFDMDFSLGNGVCGEDWRVYLGQIMHHAEALGVRFVQAHAPTGKPIAEDNEAMIQNTLRSIEACGLLGIPNIVVHSGYEKGLTKEECFARNRDFYRPLLEMAERCNVNVLVENFNKMTRADVYWIDNAPDLLELIQYIDHPRFHAAWDTGHGNLQEMPPHEALALLGSHVRALHVQDNLGDMDTHWAPFFGSMNPDSLMRGLAEIGYGGYFTFEAKHMLLPQRKRRAYEGDTRLARAPLSLRIKAERFLYDIGVCMLEAYDCFEE